MLKFPHVQSTPEIDQLIDQVIGMSIALTKMPLTDQIKQSIFHQQYLKSSLFSARIEGNTLTLGQIQSTAGLSSKEKQQIEVRNILHVLSKLSTWKVTPSKDLLQDIHELVLKDLDEDAGVIRNEQSAIFDQFGNVVYLTPNPITLALMIEEYFLVWKSIQTQREWIRSIASFHYYFEKMHPFLDGNGRVGRVVLHLHLASAGCEDRCILPIDEYIENHRAEYYAFLERNSSDCTDFTIFLLKGIAASIESLFVQIQQNMSTNDPDEMNLLPRRKEILSIISDHPYATLDLIARRFSSIPRRTLSYDVAWLIEKNFLVKYGKTRGVCYCLRDKDKKIML